MSTEIYYFSGTGNSFVVARDIAGKTDGKLIPIPSLIDKDRIITDAEVIGIVFPIYNAIFGGIPQIVTRFVEKMDNLDLKYIFVVCTCKGWSRVAISKLGEIIKTRGGKLSAGFTVPMPDNSSPTTNKEQQKLFNYWKKKKLENIYRYVNARKNGKFENTVLYNIIMAPFTSSIEKTTLKLYNKLANTTNLTFDELFLLADRSYFTDENCNGCGICAKICPVNDIKMTNNKPVWQNHCESCLACVNYCPQMAIHGNIVSTDKLTTRYHHPDVKLSDMLLRN